MNSLKTYLSTMLVSSIIWSQPFAGGPRVTTLILMLLGLFVLAKKLFPITDARLKKFTILLALFWIPAALSLIGSYNHQASVKFIIALPFFIPFAAGLLYLIDNHVNKKLLFNMLLAVCLFWIADGVIQLIIGHDLFGIPPRDSERIVGPFAYHLRLSLFLAITLPLILSKLESFNWPWLPGYLAFVVFIIMLSGVRTDLLTALIAIGLYIIIKKRMKLTLMILPLVFIGGILASHYSGIAESKLKTFSGIPHSYSQWNQASSYRLDVWLTAWNMYLAHPIIGVGTQAFTEAYDEYKTPDNYFNQQTNPISHAHHPAISIAAETGSIGLIGLLTFIWLIYQWGAKSLNKNMWAIPWLQILILIFFPIQSMPLLFSFWWFPVVTMTILYYLAEIESKQPTAKAKCS